MVPLLFFCSIGIFLSSCAASPLALANDYPSEENDSLLPVLLQYEGVIPQFDKLKENSGLAALPWLSTLTMDSSLSIDKGKGNLDDEPLILFTHNDSFGGPWIFSYRYQSGELVRLSQIRLKNPAFNVDWEDMAPCGEGRVAIADIGDNLKIRRVLNLYIIDCQLKDNMSDYSNIRKIKFRYPGSALLQRNYDCESLFYRDGWLYFLTKERNGARFFGLEIEKALRCSGVSELTPLGELAVKGRVTSADFNPKSGLLAVLTYKMLYFYDLLPQKIVSSTIEIKEDHALPLTSSRLNCIAAVENGLSQCEAISFVGERKVMMSEESGRYEIYQLSSMNFRVDQ